MIPTQRRDHISEVHATWTARADLRLLSCFSKLCFPPSAGITFPKFMHWVTCKDVFPSSLAHQFAPNGRKSLSSRFMLDPKHFNVTFCLRIINKIQGRATTGSIVQTLIHRLQTKRWMLRCGGGVRKSYTNTFLYAPTCT